MTRIRTAYIALKYYRDNRNRAIVQAIETGLNLKNFYGSNMLRDFELYKNITYTAPELMRVTFSEIDKSDFVIIDFSEKGVGLGIEAGYAVARGKPIIVLARKGCDISTTLAGIATIVNFYSDESEIAAVVVQSINVLFKEAMP